MRNLFSFIIGAVAIVGVVVFGLTMVQIIEQKKSLFADLEYRTALLADSLKESVEPYYLNNSTQSLQKVLNKFADGQRLLGLAVFDNKGNIVAYSAELSEKIISSATVVGQSMDTDKNWAYLLRPTKVRFMSLLSLCMVKMGWLRVLCFWCKGLIILMLPSPKPGRAIF